MSISSGCFQIDQNVSRAAVDAILSITYGISPKDLKHPFIKTPEDLNAIFADVARGGYTGKVNCRKILFALSSVEVDVFPFLRHLPSWFPGVEFHKTAEMGTTLANDLLMGPYGQIQAEMVRIHDLQTRFLLIFRQKGPRSLP
jgi:hypothetical protein